MKKELKYFLSFSCRISQISQRFLQTFLHDNSDDDSNVSTGSSGGDVGVVKPVYAEQRITSDDDERQTEPVMAEETMDDGASSSTAEHERDIALLMERDKKDYFGVEDVETEQRNAAYCT